MAALTFRHFLKGADTLYVNRPLLNADDFIAWAKGQGFPTTLTADDLHVTIAFSKQPFGWTEAGEPQGGEITVEGGDREVKPLGDGGAVVLRFESPELTARWQEFRDAGASWDFEGFQPHVSISWDVPDDFDLDAVEPYTGPLVFGPEVYQPIKENWKDDVTEKAKTFREVLKAGARHSRTDMDMIQTVHDHAVALGATCNDHDDEDVEKSRMLQVDRPVNFTKNDGLGLVFGWAIVGKLDGADYYDTQGDHVTEDAMLKSCTDFMTDSRIAKDMHIYGENDIHGEVVFAWPMTEEIAKAFGIETSTTGFMIGMKPDEGMLAKFRDGTYSGFSIGGHRIKDVEV